MNHFQAKEQVHNRACEAVGRPVKELVEQMDMKLSGKKSQVGDAWESWFGVEKNSIAGPDLEEVSVELKATPVKETRNGKSAKERLVLNIINYVDEYDSEFQTSSFWHKNRYLELGFYGYEKEKEWTEWKILKAALFTYPEKDLLIIQNDWEKIHQYIRTGRAQELSEGMTMYLGACPKGQNKRSLRDQNPELHADRAMQRAYSLKSGYMTYLLRTYVFGDNEDSHIRLRPFTEGELFEEPKEYVAIESIVKDISVLQNESLEQYIMNLLEAYKGKSVEELANQFQINKKDGKYPNNINAMLISRMLGIFGDLQKSEEFLKANIEVKTIRVTTKGKIEQSMSFPSFKFKELVQEEWEDSTLNRMFDAAKFFFIVFREQQDGSYVFTGAKFWSMPGTDLITTVKTAWEETVKTLNQGVKLELVGQKVRNNFIGSKDKRIIHVRPHARLASYQVNDSNADELPVKAQWVNKPSGYSDNWMTKQCFWLNKDYVLQQITDLL